jgi:hypothetical protein
LNIFLSSFNSCKVIDKIDLNQIMTVIFQKKARKRLRVNDFFLMIMSSTIFVNRSVLKRTGIVPNTDGASVAAVTKKPCNFIKRTNTYWLLRLEILHVISSLDSQLHQRKQIGILFFLTP